VKYQVIVSDPPWKLTKGGKKSVRPNSSGGELDYKTISLSEIENIQADFAYNHAENDHVLFLWTIDKYLHQSEAMLVRLGYKIHARMVWNKVTGIPAAFTIRFGHEYLLYCYFGKLLPVAKEERGKIHSVFTEQVKRHSQKPEISYEIIERLYPTQAKLEMYARYVRSGWDGWGDEHPNSLNLENSADYEVKELL
jgi:N6-adenosine-specific RNA methylase IME4